jgi:hypothetical protein
LPAFGCAFFAFPPFAGERFAFLAPGFPPRVPWPVWLYAVWAPSVRGPSLDVPCAGPGSVRDVPRTSGSMPRRLVQEATFLQPFAVPASAREPSLLAEDLAFGQATCETVAVGDAVCAPI